MERIASQIRDHKPSNCNSEDHRLRAVPCYGIHPWFLHEVVADIAKKNDGGGGDEWKHQRGENAWMDEWSRELRDRLTNDADAVVGEIGLDGARWIEVEVDDDGGDDGGSSKKATTDEKADAKDVEKEKGDTAQDKNDAVVDPKKKRERKLSCPMPIQVSAFERQLEIAADLGRPVSIHTVKAWKELIDTLEAVSIRRGGAKPKRGQKRNRNGKKQETKTKPSNACSGKRLLPPKIFFHAFGGKPGVINSILATCKRGGLDPENDVFFGFAPCVNSRAPKTPEAIRTVGLHRLVLETDREDSSHLWEDLQKGAEVAAEALGVTVEEVAEATYKNSERLYGSKNGSLG